MGGNDKAANLVTTNKRTNGTGPVYLQTRASLITVITPTVRSLLTAAS